MPESSDGHRGFLEHHRVSPTRWDLWGVAYIVNGGCSEDGFEYFRGWVISQGRNVTELALSNPEEFGLTLNHDGDPDECECEELIYAGALAYQTITGDSGPPRTTPQPQPLGTIPGTTASIRRLSDLAEVVNIHCRAPSASQRYRDRGLAEQISTGIAGSLRCELHVGHIGGR